MKTHKASSTPLTAMGAVAALLVCFPLDSAASDEFVFSSPAAGSIYKVGDTMLIQFDMADAGVSLGRDMMGFTNDNGKTWVFLSLFLNGTDTVSQKKHYNWIIPPEVDDSRSTEVVSTVGEECRICISAYETKSVRGQSATFSIRDVSAIRSGIKSTPSAEFFTVRGSGSVVRLPAAIETGVRLFSVNGRSQFIPPVSPESGDARVSGAAGMKVLRFGTLSKSFPHY